jgi:hypothetical protein
MEIPQYGSWFNINYFGKIIKPKNKYVDKTDEKINSYIYEKNKLLSKLNSLTKTNLLRYKQIIYFNDKLIFKNIRNSSTSNFISLNLYSLKEYIDYNTNIYNHYYYILTTIQSRLKYIDCEINILRSSQL